MRLRPYVHSHDFDVISAWISDERTNALWSADRISFPLEKESFGRFLEQQFERSGDCPFVAAQDDGRVVGFICCSVNCESDEAMLKFVVVDPVQRGKGYGKDMVRLAAKYAFEIAGALLVHLNVFTVNSAARRCYESVGFVHRNTAPDAFTFKGESWGRCNMILTHERVK
ncbi:GNAT family protein [Ruminococcus sp. FC2018]|uniref:GNAT family N-acetyltransferase n=1 Tax=Ruminococcus sp. FC2018 TaxID=1410617 RepID=UPI000490FA54|nr:GNAT family protein [Ruminococcus sp. FC2018]